MYSMRPENQTHFPSLILLIQELIGMLIWEYGHHRDLSFFFPQGKLSFEIVVKRLSLMQAP